MIFNRAKKRHYSEIGQQKKILFSFVNKKGRIGTKQCEIDELFYPVNCRDFLSDVLFAEAEQKEVEQYNFKYFPEKQKIDRDKVRFAVYFTTNENLNNFKNNISILNNIEKENGLITTKFYTLGIEKDSCLLVEGSKMWLNCTFSLHLYTLLIKTLGYPFENKENWLEEMRERLTNEGRYLKESTRIDVVLSNLKKIFGKPINMHGFHVPTSVGFIHENGGISSFLGIKSKTIKYLKENDYVKRVEELTKNV